MGLGVLDQKAERGEIQEVTPDPREVHKSRSEYAQKQDLARDAELTTDPFEYAEDPGSYDFPGVDTGPEFRDAQGEIDEDVFIEDTLDIL